MRKEGHFSSYHVYSCSFGHFVVKNGSIFTFCADDSIKSVPVWVRYFNPSERYDLALLENDMDYCFLIYHQQHLDP